MVLGVVGSLGLTGCSSLVSLNPFVTDKEAMMDPALTGIWNCSETNGVYVIRRDGAAYAITYFEKSDVVKLKARMLQVGEARLVDVVSEDEGVLQLRVHGIARVWPEASRLRIALLDADWLTKEPSAQQLPMQLAGDSTVLTAPGDAIRGFLLKHGLDDKAYGKTVVLDRVQFCDGEFLDSVANMLSGKR